MRGAIPLLPNTPSWCGTQLNVTLRGRKMARTNLRDYSVMVCGWRDREKSSASRSSERDVNTDM
jgi:hypothetical protein